LARARRLLREWWPDSSTWPARVAALPVIPMPVRVWVLRTVGHELASQARIRSGSLVTGANLSLGRDTFINGGCLIDATAPVTVGDEVHVAHRVQILTANHRLGPSARRAGGTLAEPVVIGTGCWIGAGAIVLPGVQIGRGSVVAAGSVVTQDLPPDGLYGGIPARLIRGLAGDLEVAEHPPPSRASAASTPDTH
jgi:maltose O-acetyltransferase